MDDVIKIALRGGPADGKTYASQPARAREFEVTDYSSTGWVAPTEAPVSSRILTYLRTEETTGDGAVIFDWFDHDDPSNVVTG